MPQESKAPKIIRPYKWGARGLLELLPNNPGVITGIFKSLRHRNFALYFSGQCVSLIGSWIQQIAMGWLVFEITKSAFILSVCVFLTQIPTLFVTPFAGVVCDRFDRRHILMVTQSLFMAQSAALAFLAFTGLINLYVILALSLFFGLVVSFDAPARQSFYARIVPPEDLSNAIALNSTAINGSRFIGPAVGGILIANVGVAHCFFINALSFLATIGALYLIKPRPSERTIKTSALDDIKEGFSYVGHSVPIRAIILMLLVLSFFGVPFPMLMPAFSNIVLGGDSLVLGNLMSFIGLGAVSAALFLAARKNSFGLGKVITFACAMFGAGLFAMSFVRTPQIAYFLCVPIGFGMIAVAASCNTILQTLVDDSKRGRVMSIFTMTFFGVPPLGSLVQGWLSNYIPLPYIAAFCGIMCVLAAVAFESYRPIIRAHTRKIYAEKGIILPEIAQGLQSSNRKPVH